MLRDQSLCRDRTSSDDRGFENTPQPSLDTGAMEACNHNEAADVSH